VVELGEDLQRLGLAVGRIVAVAEHAGARAPSYLLTLDLGAQGHHECSVPRGEYEQHQLEGTQVLCARQGREVSLVAVHSHAHGVVLLRPDRDVEDGSTVA
jgi:hypothetical protein